MHTQIYQFVGYSGSVMRQYGVVIGLKTIWAMWVQCTFTYIVFLRNSRRRRMSTEHVCDLGFKRLPCRQRTVNQAEEIRELLLGAN